MALVEIALNGGSSAQNDLQMVKDIGQVLFWVVMAFAASVAVFRFDHERKAYFQQRAVDLQRNREELNFRMHAEAQRHLELIKTNPSIRSAFTMMDYAVSEHVCGDKTITIETPNLLAKHLNPFHFEHDEVDIFVRQCFDEMLTALSEISNMISAGLVAPWVFEPSMFYYAQILSDSPPISRKDISEAVVAYAEEFEMSRALELHSQLKGAYDDPIQFANNTK